MQIDIDFEVFKRLTALRTGESDSYNAVLRRILKLKADGSKDAPQPGGYMAAGRHLPNGTKLKAKHKSVEYFAEVKEGRIFSKGGKVFNSLSAAANNITKNNVNGLRFWRAYRPGDSEWVMVASLAKHELQS